MSFFEVFLLAIGLSMDAFAVAVCAGLGMTKISFRKVVTVGLYFGFFQAIMPLIGYLLASLFADNVVTYGNLIACGLLGFLGVRMIIGSLKKEVESCEKEETSVQPKVMLPLALATSIDALAVGVSFAFIEVKILPAVSLIGVTTLILSIIGVKIGNIFGARFKSKAEFLGGLILIIIGISVLF